MSYIANWVAGSIKDSLLVSSIGFFSLIQYLLGNVLTIVAQGLGYFLKFQGNYFENITIVQESWKVFRDFSNLFFILILIIIAFATILDLPNYNWKGLMAKFIMAALLINFSMAIGGFVIKISTTLSNVALSQFSDITANLAAGFRINQFITAAPAAGTSPDASANLLMSTFLYATGTAIMTVIILCAFISAFAFSIARVPVLWALLIVSPVAWISSVLPQTRNIWSAWWKSFLCWTFFMPAYLFSLVIGIAILNNRSDIETATRIGQGSTGVLSAAGNVFGFGIQDIFFYVLTIFILVGSIGIAMKMACAGADKTIGAISGTVNKFVKDKSGYTAWKKGLQEKLKEIKETGLKGKIGGAVYGGERAERLREAKVAEYLGKKGALSETEAAEVKKSYDQWKAQNLDKGQLDGLNTQAAAGKYNKFEMLALRQLRAENGWVATGTTGRQEIENTIREAGEGSKFAQEYIKALKKNGFAEALGSIGEAESLAQGTTLPSLKRAVLETMAKNNQIIKEDLIDKTLQVFASESQSVKDAIEKELQKNIKNIEGARSKKDRGQFLIDEDNDHSAEVKRLAAQQMAEDGEITTYQKYKIAAELFGGENETKSREMLGKIASTKERSIAHADILFRKELGKTQPDTLRADYNPFTDPQLTQPEREARQRQFIAKTKEKLPKMTAKAVIESDADFWDRNQPTEFETALWEHIETEEQAEPTTRRGTREKAGGGKRIVQRIQKALQDSPDPDKKAVIDRLTNRLNTTYPPINNPPRPRTP